MSGFSIPRLHLHPVILSLFLPLILLFPTPSVPWYYIILLLGSVPVLLARGIVTLSGKNPVLTLAAAAGGQSMISYGKYTTSPASLFPSESAHRWDYLSALVGFPSALFLLWESRMISLMITKLSASVRPVREHFPLCTKPSVPCCTSGKITE